MKRLVRGARPPELDGIKGGRPERDRARTHFVDEAKVDGFDFEAYSHRNVRQALAAMGAGKCAYCEAYYDATQPQDVEHYRPKGRIDIDGGKIQPAYWWLAADWDNLLPSCIHCNRLQNHVFPDGSELKSGKGERFPLDDETARGRAEGGEGGEVPLLIDPCREDPVPYLRFVEEDERSIVKPAVEDPRQLAARRARASIDIYGLNRPGLVNARSADLKRIKTSLLNVRFFAHALESAAPDEIATIEERFFDEVAFLRRHASGETGFSAMARPVIEPVFVSLGLTLTL